MTSAAQPPQPQPKTARIPCPRCGKPTNVERTMPFDGTCTVRYHRCPACKRRFRTEQRAASG